MNLLFTCVAEEAFFRGLLQGRMARALESAGRHRLAFGLPLCASALVFGLAHAAGSPSYVLMASLAGLGYAWSYAVTGRIEVPILLHWTLNALHFMAFTYPGR